MKKEDFFQSINDLNQLLRSSKNLFNNIEYASFKIIESLKNSGKLLICGNGGSAADAQHMAAEFVNRFLRERLPLAAIALSTDTSNITSIANDYSFDDIFSKQVLAIAKKNDVVLGISTSGNSENIFRAIKTANDLGCFSVGLLGRDGGKTKNICSKAIIVNSNFTPRIQEMHIFIIHTICKIVEDAFVGD